MPRERRKKWQKDKTKQNKTQHSVHENVGLIPGVTQWVKDLALPKDVA